MKSVILLFKLTLISGLLLLSCTKDNTDKKNRNHLIESYFLDQQNKANSYSNSCGYYANVTGGTILFNAALNIPSNISTPLLFATTGESSPAAIVKVTLAASQKLIFTTLTSKISDFTIRYYPGNLPCPINISSASSTALTASGDLVNTYNYAATSSNAGFYTFVIYNTSFLVSAPTDYTIRIQ